MSHKEFGNDNEEVNHNHRGRDDDDDAPSIVELSLGLGLIGSSPSFESSSSSSPFLHHHHQVNKKKKKKNDDDDDDDDGVGLGLKLGLGLLGCSGKNGKGVMEEEEVVESPPPARNNGGGAFINCTHQHEHKEAAAGLWACSGGHPITTIQHDAHHHHHHRHHHVSMPKSPSLSWSSLPHFHHCLQRPPPTASRFVVHSSPLIQPGRCGVPSDCQGLYQGEQRDENVTVLKVQSYLVTKLGLSNQDQVEISCMGQKLVHSQSLKYVRDAIWFPRFMESLNPKSSSHFQQGYYPKRQSTLTCIMPLDYGPTTYSHPMSRNRV